MKPLEYRHKKLLPILFGLLVASIIAMIMLKGCSTSKPSIGSGFDKSLGDTIDVAIDYGPMSMYVEGDSVGGFNYEVVRVLERCCGLPLKIHPVATLDSALTLLSAGLIDVIATDAPITLDYKSRFSFTEPVYLDRQVLVESLLDSVGDGKGKIESQLDLARRNVWIVAGSPAEGRLHNLMAEIGDTIYIHSDPQYSAEMLYMLTSIGEIGMCVVNERVARAMARKDSDKESARISTSVSFTQFQGWIVEDASDRRAKERIDSALTEFKRTEEFKKLCRRYGVDSPM